MELLLNRVKYYDTATIGELFLDGVKECYTLEDTMREKKGVPVVDWKIKGLTAIPCGRYKVIITLSPHFQKMLMRLVNVEGYDGVLIHAGNKPEDTDGCILVGQIVLEKTIGISKVALEILQGKVQAALTAGQEVYITVKNK